MNIYEIQNKTADMICCLTAVWERSVRATHLFLTDAEIQSIKVYVPQALKSVSHLIAAERERACPTGFMGVEGRRLEMLFISPEERGAGLGRQLIEYGIRNYGIRQVTVNEQNLQAVGFYKHMGFKIYKRTDFDEQGEPYPLLYMKMGG